MNTYSQFFCGNDGGALDISNSGLTHPAPWLVEAVTGGVRSDAGVSVNGYTALTSCPLWQGVNIIAGDLGQVPIRLVKDEFHDQKDHPAYKVLSIEPNRLQTPLLFMETMIQWALIWGNAVALIIRRGSRPVELIPLRADCLQPELIGSEDEPQMYYHYTSPLLGKRLTFHSDDVLHIQGLTGDGIWGYPLWQVAKNTIGFGLALQKHGNRQFSNGAKPSGVLEHPGKLEIEARKHLREEWERVHGGANNSGKTAVLWEGMKFNPISMNNVDSQWMEGMDMSVIDAARLLNMPAYKLNYTKDSSMRSNMEEQNETYKQMTLTRWAKKIDQECRKKLLTAVEYRTGKYEFVFDWDAFLRADIDTLTQVGDRCVKGEIMNRNEARRMIRLPPYEGGEKYGNPATASKDITDKVREAGDSPDNGQPTGAKTENSAHKELLYDHILHLVEKESTCVRQAARESKNFVAWLDDFYVGANALPKINTLATAIMGTTVRACLSAGLQTSGLDRAIANYAKHRHAVLLEACSDVTQAELPTAIEKVINSQTELVAQGLLATSIGDSNET